MIEAPPAPSSTRRRLFIALRIAVTVGALAWTIARVSLRELGAAAARMPPTTVLLAVLIVIATFMVAAFRSRVLLYAYGAPRPLTFLALCRLHWAGIFYNTFLPGNVAGDLVRAHAMREAFQGAAGSWATVAIERVFGLAGLFALAACVVSVHPVPGVPNISALAVVALIIAAGAAAAPVVGRRLTFLPGKLGKLAASLPTVVHPTMLPIALVLSMCTQALVALTGYVLVRALFPAAQLADMLVLVPFASVAAYFPASVAGLGVREAALVALLGAVGVSRPDATAVSFAYLATQLVVAAVGGLMPVAAKPSAQSG